MSFTFSPIIFWPLISQIWWSVRRPLRAAELSCTIEVIRPFLKRKPSCPFMSLWRVTVRSNGLQTVIVFSVLVYNCIMNMHVIVYRAKLFVFFFVKLRKKKNCRGVFCRLSFAFSCIASLHPFPYLVFQNNLSQRDGHRQSELNRVYWQMKLYKHKCCSSLIEDGPGQDWPVKTFPSPPESEADVIAEKLAWRPMELTLSQP